MVFSFIISIEYENGDVQHKNTKLPIQTIQYQQFTIIS